MCLIFFNLTFYIGVINSTSFTPLANKFEIIHVREIDTPSNAILLKAKIKDERSDFRTTTNRQFSHELDCAILRRFRFLFE
jgi:hypothetical protein